MSDTILNQDGSVYMTFPPAVPSPADLEGWTVRQVSTGTHGPTCPHSAQLKGTFAVTCVDVESFNGLLKVVGALADEYGYRPVSARVGSDSYRWSFERWAPDGHRITDMLIVSKIH
jgi:hypothetical protein